MFKIFQHLFSFSNFPAPFSVKCLKVPSTFLFFTFCSTCPSLSDWVWCGMSCATNRWTDPETCFETLLLFQTVVQLKLFVNLWKPVLWNLCETCENPCCPHSSRAWCEQWKARWATGVESWRCRYPLSWLPNQMISLWYLDFDTQMTKKYSTAMC